MRLTKEVVKNLRKTFLNLGQATIIGGFIEHFLNREIQPAEAIIPFFLGMFTIFCGLYFISGMNSLED